MAGKKFIDILMKTCHGIEKVGGRVENIIYVGRERETQNARG